MIVGYVAGSMGGGGSPHSRKMLSQEGCSVVFEETEYGSDADFRRALDSLKPGDTLLILKLDELGMNIKEIVVLILQLAAGGIHFRSKLEEIDTRQAVDPIGLCQALLSADAGAHRRKSLAGTSRASRSGKHIGRPPVLSAEDIVAFRQLVETSGVSIREAAAQLGISETTLQGHARKLGITLRRRQYGAGTRSGEASQRSAT